MERILVTGATGFLGGHVARRLRADGASVVGLGRNAGAGVALRNDGIDFVAVDLCDAAALESLFENVDVIVHCAARSSVWGPFDGFVRDNVLATENVVAAATRHRVKRLVHVSSPSIYHNGKDRWQVREDAALPGRGINAYAETKRQAEHIVDAATGLHTVTLRPRALFGPGDPSVLPRIIRALETRRLPILGSGKNLVDVTFIDNAVDAVLLACRKNVVSGRKYNITNGEPIDLWSFIQRLADRLGLPRPRGRLARSAAKTMAAAAESFHRRFLPHREPVLTRYGVDLLTLSTTLDISRARYELGYTPKVSIADGLDRFANYFHQQEQA